MLVLIAWVGAVRAAGVGILTSPEIAAPPLDRAAIRSIFSMRLRQWPDGRAVRVFVLPDNHALHVRFCREQLGTYPYVLRSTWDRLVYTGTGVAPEVVGSETEMRQRVLHTPGAIGYVSSDTQTGAQIANPYYEAVATGGAP